MKKTISLISKDLGEISFVLEGKVKKEYLERLINNAEFGLILNKSSYNEFSYKIQKNKKNLKKVLEIIKERDKAYEEAKENILLVIVWEDYNFIPYKNFKINDLKYIWQKEEDQL